MFFAFSHSLEGERMLPFRYVYIDLTPLLQEYNYERPAWQDVPDSKNIDGVVMRWNYEGDKLTSTLIEKNRKFSSYIRKVRWDRLQSHT